MTNLAGIAPIEHTKAVTHIMHQTIHVNFHAQMSAQFERIKNFTSMTSQAIRLDVQGKKSNRFALFMAVQFFLPWYPFGVTLQEWYSSFIPFEDAWREPRPCCVQLRAHHRRKRNI